jgi:hypothetical protein
MFLAINYTKTLTSAVSSRHSLHIEYNVRELNYPPPLIFEDIFFNITNITTSGTIPDVKALSGCPLPVANFDIGTPPESNWTCSKTCQNLLKRKSANHSCLQTEDIAA